MSITKLFHRYIRHLVTGGLMLSLIFSSLSSAHAQRQYQISGTVADENGVPLVGVSVFEKGTENGVPTDVDGRFTISSSRQNPVLTFSCIGFLDMEKKSEEGKPLHVVMTEDSQLLDEVQVIGYAVIKKSDLTGSVASVKSDVMEGRMVLSVEDALRGQLAGVSILSTDGAPGSSMNIRIRGTNSINASNSPLYVIDGVLMESTDISPSEIESMEILKDASSTAIYGSRGANGVVVITTKKGKAAAPRINFSTTISMQQPTRLYKMMNSEEFARYCRAGYGRVNGDSRDYYDNEGYVWNVTYASPYATRYEEILNGDFTTDTDWQKEMLKNALTQEYRLSISGGDQKGTYSVIGSVLSQDGIILKTGMDRYNVRVNFDRSVYSWLKIGVNASGSSQSTQNTTGNVIKQMLSRPPTKESGSGNSVDITDENSIINQDPVSQALSITNDQKRLNFTAKGWADISFAKIFRLNVSGSYNYTRNKTERYYPSDVQTGNGSVVGGKAQSNISETINWLNENLLYITPKLSGIHSFDALAGVTLQGNNIYGLNTEANKFPYEDKGVYNMEMGLTPIPTTNHYTKSSLLSFLARANYKIKDRYLFTGSIRADGSSRLAKGNKWGYFPSGAIAWRAVKEPFIQKLHIFSDLNPHCS
ncbi:MAG: SusC/RagA family TonB-linked outer membrane protein [Candidatus Cryptobacteroides sp.]